MITKTRGKRNDASNLLVGNAVACPEGLSNCICGGAPPRRYSWLASHAADTRRDDNRGYALGTVASQWTTYADMETESQRTGRLVRALVVAILFVLGACLYLSLAPSLTGQASETQPGQASHWKGPKMQNRQARVSWGGRGGVA